MKELKDYLKSNFTEQYSDKTILSILYFKPKQKVEAKILVVGSEHGDKIHGTKAMIQLMHELYKKPLEKTQIDFIPVIDTEGYPDKRTVIGNEGLGKPLYLDSGYKTNKMPEQIKDLLDKVNPDYNLALQLNTAFKEEMPLINGYFIVPQINKKIVEKGDEFKTQLKIDSRYKDLIGTILNSLNKNEIQLLTENDNGYLGDGHILAMPGLVLPGIEENNSFELKTRNVFARKCQKKEVLSLELVTLAQKITTEPNNEVVRAHKVALDTLVKLYEL